MFFFLFTFAGFSKISLPTVPKIPDIVKKELDNKSPTAEKTQKKSPEKNVKKKDSSSELPKSPKVPIAQKENKISPKRPLVQTLDNISQKITKVIPEIEEKISQDIKTSVKKIEKTQIHDIQKGKNTLKTINNLKGEIKEIDNLVQKNVKKTKNLVEKDIEKINNLGEKGVKKTKNLGEKGVKKTKNLMEKDLKKINNLEEGGTKKTKNIMKNGKKGLTPPTPPIVPIPINPINPTDNTSNNGDVLSEENPGEEQKYNEKENNNTFQQSLEKTSKNITEKNLPPTSLGLSKPQQFKENKTQDTQKEKPQGLLRKISLTKEQRKVIDSLLSTIELFQLHKFFAQKPLLGSSLKEKYQQWISQIHGDFVNINLKLLEESFSTFSPGEKNLFKFFLSSRSHPSLSLEDIFILRNFLAYEKQFHVLGAVKNTPNTSLGFLQRLINLSSTVNPLGNGTDCILSPQDIKNIIHLMYCFFRGQSYVFVQGLWANDLPKEDKNLSPDEFKEYKIYENLFLKALKTFLECPMNFL